MASLPFRLTSVLIAFALVVAGCSTGEKADDTTGAAVEAPDSASTASPGKPTSSLEPTAEGSMTVADIDRWQKGMTAELAAVREAGTKMKAAKTSTDTLTIMMETQETSTRAAGAKAAGVEEARYGLIASTLSSIVRYMTPLDLEMDTKQMPASIKTAMQEDRDKAAARLSEPFQPAVIAALRPRAAELRKQEMSLTQERLRAAGMIR